MKLERAAYTCAGAALALLAVALLDDDGASSDIAGPGSRASAINVARAPAAPRPSDAAPPEPAAALMIEERPATAAPEVAADAPRTAPTRNPIVANAPPSNSPSTTTDLPNRRDGDASATPAADLLGSPRISCDFDAGNNTGMRSGEVLTVGGGAQWRGDLLIYDLVDAAAGTARLTGNPGVTGSPSGEAKVQVVTEGTRVFLSGFLANGAFVMVTIFDDLDNVGRHIAVMSRHERTFSYASQFLGTCE
jgi:hypothetical protein